MDQPTYTKARSAAAAELPDVFSYQDDLLARSRALKRESEELCARARALRDESRARRSGTD